MDTAAAHHTRLWTLHGINNIKPNSMRYKEYPEGWDVPGELRRILGPFVGDRVLEIGCGYGRVAPAFDPDKYIGVDINPNALEKAKQLLPAYDFREIGYVGDYPEANMVLAYTVFLHIPDTELANIISAVGRSEYIVVAECLGETPKDSNTTNTYAPESEFHPVYTRLQRHYDVLMASSGFCLYERIVKPYRYYAGADLDILIYKRSPPLPTSLDFPSGLSNPFLDFEGIFEDGWVAPSMRVRMTSPANATLRVVGECLPGGHRTMTVRLKGTSGKSTSD